MKNPKTFSTACKIWEESLNLQEVNQKFTHGGLLGYRNSFLYFLFATLKVFQLHIILHNSPGAVKATKNRDPG